MFEIKITGSTAEEMRKDFKELSIILGLTGGQAPTKVDAVKNEEVKQVEVNTTQEPPLEEANEPAAEEVTEGGVHSSEDETTVGEEQETKEAVTHTLEEVRAVARVLQQDGKMAFIKRVINAAGAERLTELDPQKYSWVLKCFEAGEVIE